MQFLGRVVLTAGALVCLTAGIAHAQTTSSATETKKFQVIAVDGSDLVVKLPEGTRELTVPDDFKFTVDGKQLSVHELKPGMAGTATITTRTTVTPVTVTEVKNGTVKQVTGSSIIVQTPQGFKSFTQGDLDKRGVKLYRAGKPSDLSEFHTGDVISATIVTSKPPKVVTAKEVNASLATSGASAPAASGAGAAPAARPTSGASGSAPARTTAAPSAAAPEAAPAAAPAKKLPKTGGPLPLIGLIGLLSTAGGAALSIRRRLAQ